MNFSNIKTPGVYISGNNNFPNSFNPSPAAIPAFIGYTPQASYQGKSYINEPFKISSFTEFLAIFCFPNPEAPAVKQYNPQYYLVEQKAQPSSGNFVQLNNTYYSILPDASTIYYMYNSIRLFYQNGGGDAYIVSVGTYGPVSNTNLNVGDPLVNPNIKLSDLQNGLALLSKNTEPNLYVCPDATLLNAQDNSTLMKAMLLQSSDMKSSISIFDVIGGAAPDATLWQNDIATFRNNVGTVGLEFGAAYYPFVQTSIVQSQEIDYTNLFGGNTQQLASLLNPASNPNQALTNIFSNIQSATSTSTVSNNNMLLLNASAAYSQLMQNVLANVNTLPPSAAMAGIINTIDTNQGPWEAPANVSVASAVALPIDLNDTEQATLNIDAVSGKSINAIRLFNNNGILVWGARTLNGNSVDWRYINVRRTAIYIEQECKLALQNFVFEPNTANTWMNVKETLTGFLTNIWKAGGLQGSTPEDAFKVEVGLGSTMTAIDILDGYMKVVILLAISHPAEFIEINMTQAMRPSVQ